MTRVRRLGAILLLTALATACTSPAEAVWPADDGGPVKPWITENTDRETTRADIDPSLDSETGMGDVSGESGDTVEVVEPEYEPPDGMEMVFYDIGQGDSILVRFPKGTTMLVDGGNKSAAGYAILPHFEEIHLVHLDYLVVTHPDADHCGGLDDVVNSVEVGEVWENGQVKDTWAWWDFSEAVEEKGITRVTVQRGDEYTIDGCNVEVLNSDEGWDDFNGNSIVLSVDCEGIKLLLTGDAHAGTQADLIDVYGEKLESDIVKVPHHGSPDHYVEFPAFVSPSVAVCSVGEDNSYGHPAIEVIDAWEEAGADFYRTDEFGTVTVTAAEGELDVETEY